MQDNDRTFQTILRDATPAERAEHQAHSAKVAETLTAITEAQGTTVLHLTAAETDTLRFILNVVIHDDFGSPADGAAFLSLCEKAGA